MATLDRRDFLGGSLAVGGSLLVGCSGSELTVEDAGTAPRDGGVLARDGGTEIDAGFRDAGTRDGGAVEQCDDLFASGTNAGPLGFEGEDGAPLDTLIREGWDGRLYTDLSTVDKDTLTIDNDRFYVRTRFPDLLASTDNWMITVGGLAQNATLPLDAMMPLSVPQGLVLLECSGNGRGGAFGLLSTAEWSGIPIEEIFARVQLDPAATRVEVRGFDMHSVPSAGGHSTPGASWVFTFDELMDAGAFLATHMNGVPLPPDHGEPVRLMVPGWYGCCNIKWVDGLNFVDETAPATSQMREFASRTHQNGNPRLARDFIPATMDQSAMPTRVERWDVGGETVYRIIGIMWGGYEVTDRLAIRFNGGAAEPVDVCPAQMTNRTWTVWEHLWRPTAPGTYSIRMAIDDPNIRTRRLDSGYYERTVVVDRV